MSNTSKFYLFILTLCITPLMSMAQMPGDDGIHERGMMKNRTNVERESSEYQIGIIKDTTRFRKSLMKFVGTSLVYDDATEDENEILREASPRTAIHRIKKDFSNLVGSIKLPLVDYRSKKYYSFPCEGVRVTSRFGPRRNRYHYGIDLGLRIGEPIRAMFDGRVRVSRMANGYGNLIVLEHDNQLETYYAHLSKINVYDGEIIKAGEVIGLGGSTGHSTGPHLHLEIRYEGAAINPEDVINFSSYSLLDNSLELTKDNFRHHSINNSNLRLAKNSYHKSSKHNRYKSKSSNNKQYAKLKMNKSKSSKSKHSKRRR